MFLETPQIIVQQRFDPAYDGGKPVWEKPAVVYASGSVASIGVIVTGIRKCGKLNQYGAGEKKKENILCLLSEVIMGRSINRKKNI